MSLTVASKRRSLPLVEAGHPGAVLLDVTSGGAEPWLRFSPFYPHGDIPVPLSPGATSWTVEGVWQALKVFERGDVDPSKLAVKNMRGIKRTARRHGQVLGHREGLGGERLLGYVDARRRIYLPTYLWVLEHKVGGLVEDLSRLSASRDVVLLDYSTNGDPEDVRTPLSHAALLCRYVQGTWPG